MLPEAGVGLGGVALARLEHQLGALHGHDGGLLEGFLGDVGVARVDLHQHVPLVGASHGRHAHLALLAGVVKLDVVIVVQVQKLGLQAAHVLRAGRLQLLLSHF